MLILVPLLMLAKGLLNFVDSGGAADSVIFTNVCNLFLLVYVAAQVDSAVSEGQSSCSVLNH